MDRRTFRKAMLSTLLLVLALSVEHVVAQNRTTEQEEAAIKDPNAECATYTLPITTSNSASFPEVGKKASILPNDSVAKAKWDEMSGKVLSTAPKPAAGKSNGYDASDPDCWWTFDQCTTPKAQGVPPDVVMVPPPSTMGYGFDDGPYCGHNEFYDFLKSNNQTATMFFIGSNVFQWPLEAQRALVDGHEICVHTWSHPYLTSLSSEDVFAELYYSVQAIKLIAGVTPTCFRPPYGDIDDRVRSIAAGLGLQSILWSYDSQDADVGTSGVTEQSVDDSYNSFISTAKNGTFGSAGTILLEHEVDNYTVSKAMEYYPQLKQAFKYMVPVGVALNKTQPYVETNFTLPSFEQYIAGTTVVTAAPTSTSASSASASATAEATPTSTQGDSQNLSNAGFVTIGMPPATMMITCFVFSALAFVSVL